MSLLKGKGKRNQPPMPGNGRPQPQIQNYLEGLASTSQIPSVIKELIQAGNEPGDIMMRCYVKDDREAIKIIRSLTQFKRFKMPDRFRQSLVEKMKINCSIDGRSRKEVVMASAGVVVSDYVTAALNGNGNGKKSRHPRPDKDESDERDDE